MTKTTAGDARLPETAAEVSERSMDAASALLATLAEAGVIEEKEEDDAGA